jgi:hypothetical protein
LWEKYDVVDPKADMEDDPSANQSSLVAQNPIVEEVEDEDDDDEDEDSTATSA